MKKILLPLIILLTAQQVDSQQQVLDISAPASTGGNYGSVRFYDPATLGSKSVQNLNYTDIEGTPFWDDQWNPGRVILTSGSVIKLPKIKINLYTNEIYYYINQVVLAAETGTIQTVILYKQNDTSKVLAVFESLPDFTNKSNTSNAFFRVFNNGKVKLLCLHKSLIMTKPYDPIVGKAEKSFFIKTYYCISNNGNIFTLKSLDRSNVLSTIITDNKTENWLTENKNKLKSESEIIEFLNYYNIQNK